MAAEEEEEARKRKESSRMEEVEEAIKSIPEKKENLRKAFDSLRSHSSSVPVFNFQWKDMEDHFSSIEKSIDERLTALHQKMDADPKDAARPTLISVCANMNADLLRSYSYHDRQSIRSSWKDLVAAFRSAPDPALLVLHTIEGAFSNLGPSSFTTAHQFETSNPRWTNTTISLLEKLSLISPAVSPLVMDRAKNLAADWRSKLPMSSDGSGDFAYGLSLCLLHLIVLYGIVAHFPLDDVMELITSVSRSSQVGYFVTSLGLIDKLPDLIQKLISKRRRLDAVKFAYAFDMVDKFPPVPLLKAYITESDKEAQEIRKKGNNSLKAEKRAAAGELGALIPVLKVVEKYNLGTEYPRENLVERIAQLEGKKEDIKRIKIARLEQKKAEKKRTAATAAASNSKQQQQQPNQ